MAWTKTTRKHYRRDGLIVRGSDQGLLTYKLAGTWQSVRPTTGSIRLRPIGRADDEVRIETMKGPAESGQICWVGRRKIAKKIAKNKRCYANTLRPRSKMLLSLLVTGRSWGTAVDLRPGAC